MEYNYDLYQYNCVKGKIKAHYQRIYTAKLSIGQLSGNNGTVITINILEKRTLPKLRKEESYFKQT